MRFIIVLVIAYIPASFSFSFLAAKSQMPLTTKLSAHPPSFNHDNLDQKRRYLATLFPLIMTHIMTPQSASAVDDTNKTVWLTGKAPRVPGQAPRDKNDVTGTKKDPKFLRSLSDCKSQCENSVGADGYARTKEDCLSQCQDICCTTYEQCTFAIVPRI
jgi:hypothetical protein